MRHRANSAAGGMRKLVLSGRFGRARPDGPTTMLSSSDTGNAREHEGQELTCGTSLRVAKEARATCQASLNSSGLLPANPPPDVHRGETARLRDRELTIVGRHERPAENQVCSRDMKQVEAASQELRGEESRKVRPRRQIRASLMRLTVQDISRFCRESCPHLWSRRMAGAPRCTAASTLRSQRRERGRSRRCLGGSDRG